MHECLLYASALYPFMLKLRDNLFGYFVLIAVWIPLRMRLAKRFGKNTR
ncbi:hypothetical protein [Thermofilum sp.]|jgi:hypothetical protein